MKKHVKILGVLYIAGSGIGTLAAVGVAFLLSFLQTVLGDSAGSEEITVRGRMFLTALAVFLVAMVIPGLVGGIGLLKRRPWARTLVLVLGFVNLVFFPFGTVLGIYTVWALLREETVRLFGPAGEAADTPVRRLAGERDYRLAGLIWMAAAVTFTLCIALSVGTLRGADRAVAVGVWGLIPLAVGVAMFLYGMTAHKERKNSPGLSGRGGAAVPGFLCGVLSASLLASTAFAYTHEETIQKTVPATGITRLTVQNANGSIRLEPWDRPDIQVEARKRISASSQEIAESFGKKVEIAVESEENHVRVQTVMPGRQEDWDWVESFFSFDWLFEGFGRGTTVSYTISAPRKLDTELRSTNGSVRVGAMEGATHLMTTNGAIVAEGFRGALTGRSTNGSVTLSRMDASCDVATTNGKIRAEFFSLRGQGCKLRTTNGSVRVALPDSIRADLVASTTNGRIACDLPIALIGESTRRRMEGKINGGGPSLEIRTTNGAISVEGGDGNLGRVIPPTPDKAGMLTPKSPSQARIPESAAILKVQVWESGNQKVLISVPISLAEQTLRSLPEEARDEIRDKGIDIDSLLSDILKNPRPGRLVEIQDEDRRVIIDLAAE